MSNNLQNNHNDNNVKIEIEKNNNSKISYFKPEYKFFWIVQLVCILLFVFVIYNDIYTNFLSFGKLGITKLVSNKVLNYILKTLGAYGLIQVFSQDMGIPTGNFQMAITHYPISKLILLFSTGFALTGDRSESLIATILYFYLRNVLSTKLVTASTWAA